MLSISASDGRVEHMRTWKHYHFVLLKIDVLVLVVDLHKATTCKVHP